MVCTSTAPIDFIAIVGSAPPLHFHVPLNRRLGVEPQPLAMGSRHEVPPPVCAAPVLLVAPLQALVRMAKPDPRAQLLAQLFVHLRKRLVTTDRRVEAQEVKPGLPFLDVQGLGDAGLARFQFPSHAA